MMDNEQSWPVGTGMMDNERSQYLKGYLDAETANAAERKSFWPLMALAWTFGVLVGVTGLFLFLALAPASAETIPFRNPVTAQEHNTCANVLLAVQLTDAYTTRQIIARGGYERNPLAKPFVSSNFGAYASAIVLNGVARLLTRHTSPSSMCADAAVESVFVINNLRVIGNQR